MKMIFMLIVIIITLATTTTKIITIIKMCYFCCIASGLYVALNNYARINFRKKNCFWVSRIMLEKYSQIILTRFFFGGGGGKFEPQL